MFFPSAMLAALQPSAERTQTSPKRTSGLVTTSERPVCTGGPFPPGSHFNEKPTYRDLAKQRTALLLPLDGINL
jgi:hypothetical protein